MTTIESNTNTIKASAQTVYEFVSNLDNFGKITPEQIINLVATPDTAAFTIKGMTDLTIAVKERIASTMVIMESEGKAPFTFTMTWNITRKDDTTCETNLVLKAALNPMLQMLAASPLRNFVNMLNDNLKKHLES